MPEAKDESKGGNGVTCICSSVPVSASFFAAVIAPPSSMSVLSCLSVYLLQHFGQGTLLRIWDTALWAMSEGTSILNGAAATTMMRGYSRALHL